MNWRNAHTQTDHHPVVCVSHNDALAYADWLSKRTGKPFRLPSEAEWEYAARAGTATRYSFGDSATAICAHGNSSDRSLAKHYGNKGDVADGWANCDDGYAYTAPVGSYAANGFGLHDMHGNVYEWVQDCWNGSYSGAPADGSAWERGYCGQRVLRGGAWEGMPSWVRAASRAWSTQSGYSGTIGFRLAQNL